MSDRQHQDNTLAQARATLAEVSATDYAGERDLLHALGRLQVALELALDVAADVRTERDALAAVARAAYAEGREHEARERAGAGSQRRASHLRAVT